MERAFRLWYRDRIEHVTILFSSQVAGEIRERRWHSSQRIVDAADGAAYLHLDISAPEELERWLLGFGPNARVIEPTRLAERIQSAHAAAAGVGQVLDAAEPRRVRRSSTGAITPRARAHAQRSR
jgi:predicted DNA-binding transcriptional regulator YafY